ncbi:helix-turn-helix transcriptional regulator [Acidovorax sp. NCPPB 4044]|uniref:helix-turn-helix transcriptional regulator n=1 Tax=Acidovorax sp. NCPPB 4044 TaxID=2940490 RepID=UPI0023034B66|nr:AlpA family transcriptional regulator [Acidovorax sp. NCPPB 4044]
MAGVLEEDRLIRLPEVLRLTGMCRSAVYNQMARGQFPRSVKIGPRAASWSVKEVHAWIAQRVV